MQVDALYCLAIVKRRDVRSLRDLTAAHIPLLKNVLSEASAAINDRYGLAADALRAFIHYPPSYYHLHFHFLNAKHDGSYGMAVGARAAGRDRQSGAHAGLLLASVADCGTGRERPAAGQACSCTCAMSVVGTV